MSLGDITDLGRGSASREELQHPLVLYLTDLTDCLVNGSSV